MNHQTEREHLEDVLHAYLAASSDPNYATLNEWIRRYPYYEQELTEFTIAQNMIHMLPEPVITVQEETELIEFGRNFIQSLIGEARTSQEPASTSLESLLGVGQAIGLRLAGIAKQTRLSAALIRKLDRRLIPFATMPQEVVEQLARVLGQKVEVIAQYLQLPPMLAQGASYRAEQTPQLGELEDFFDALEKDLSISQEDRNYWLRMRPGV